MKFGFGVPCCREGITLPVDMVTTDGMIKLAQAADQMGFYSIWFDDYRAPSPSMNLPYSHAPNWYEPLITISYLASITKKVRLGTGVMVLPLRDPVLLAKQVATMDTLSGGRLFLGVGLGLYREEFKKLNPERRGAHRGHILDEMLESLEILFNQDMASFAGQYFAFRDIALYPKPVQKKIPLYFVSMVGDTEENLKRLVRWGSGFLIRPALDQVRQKADVIRPMLEEAGRDPSEIEVVAYGVMSLAKTREEALARYKLGPSSHRSKGMSDDQIVATHFIGTPSEIVEKVGRLQEAGVTHCVANTFPVDTIEEMLEQAQMYGEEILPAFR